ncbi:hypothetical protein KC19_VG206200 [Ceratodon purpureus]|uniref:Uncharacterized protein n=1 Tax=Ceratodon purpureus TaxID=3225 RepID=A0A8T0HTB7_CERPU|nr:hypothetical protein KC19_VG206200 [Ceratodon purpureus]
MCGYLNRPPFWIFWFEVFSTESSLHLHQHLSILWKHDLAGPKLSPPRRSLFLRPFFSFFRPLPSSPFLLLLEADTLPHCPSRFSSSPVFASTACSSSPTSFRSFTSPALDIS